MPVSSSTIWKVGLRLQGERNYCIFLPRRVLLGHSSGYSLRRFASSLENESTDTVKPDRSLRSRDYSRRRLCPRQHRRDVQGHLAECIRLVEFSPPKREYT